MVVEADSTFAQLSDEEQDRVHRMVRRLNPQSPITAREQDEYASSFEGMGGAVDRARREGFVVVEGQPNTLLLDLDGGDTINDILLKCLCDLLGEVPVMTRWKSKSGVGTHVVLRFEKATFTPAQAIALEGALGSDPKRVLMGVMRLKNGVHDPRVLFMPAPQWPFVLDAERLQRQEVCSGAVR